MDPVPVYWPVIGIISLVVVLLIFSAFLLIYRNRNKFKN